MLEGLMGFGGFRQLGNVQTGLMGKRGGGADPVEVAETPEVGESDQQDAEEKKHIQQADESKIENG
jgi:hypothetical protein